MIGEGIDDRLRDRGFLEFEFARLFVVELLEEIRVENLGRPVRRLKCVYRERRLLLQNGAFRWRLVHLAQRQWRVGFAELEVDVLGELLCRPFYLSEHDLF